MPFEQIAGEDKQRYDKEVVLFKKGAFQGRAPQQTKVNGGTNLVKTALEINTEVLDFIQANCQQTGGAASQAGAEEEFPEEIEDPDVVPEEPAIPTEKQQPEIPELKEPQELPMEMQSNNQMMYNPAM